MAYRVPLELASAFALLVADVSMMGVAGLIPCVFGVVLAWLIHAMG